ncbi:MAG: PspC domain-containing protein, partial [Candidatus Limnocylindria bacterium]
MPTRLERSTKNKVVAGVCGGIGEYLQVDPTLVRVFFVVGTIVTGGLGLLAYIVLIVLMPLPGQPAPFVKESGVSTSTAEGASSGDVAATTPVAPAPEDPEAADRRRAAFGFVL